MGATILVPKVICPVLIDHLLKQALVECAAGHLCPCRRCLKMNANINVRVEEAILIQSILTCARMLIATRCCRNPVAPLRVHACMRRSSAPGTRRAPQQRPQVCFGL